MYSKYNRYQLLVLWEVYAQLADINTQEDISHSNIKIFMYFTTQWA